jgi:'Cold-shock' DNA-binding domain
LASIVFTIAFGMIDVTGLRNIRRESPGEFYLAVVTAAAVVVIGVEQHISAVERAGLSSLNEGQVVEYEEVSNRGKTSAENLRVQR